jgi:hypothetical protein
MRSDARGIVQRQPAHSFPQPCGVEPFVRISHVAFEHGVLVVLGGCGFRQQFAIDA